jgi:hypothetical protein
MVGGGGGGGFSHENHAEITLFSLLNTNDICHIGLM